MLIPTGNCIYYGFRLLRRFGWRKGKFNSIPSTYQFLATAVEMEAAIAFLIRSYI